MWKKVKQQRDETRSDQASAQSRSSASKKVWFKCSYGPNNS